MECFSLTPLCKIRTPNPSKPLPQREPRRTTTTRTFTTTTLASSDPGRTKTLSHRSLRFFLHFFFFRFRFLNISNSFRGELYRRCLGFSKMLVLNVKILRRKLLAVLVHESTVNIELFVFRFLFLITDFFFVFGEV